MQMFDVQGIEIMARALEHVEGAVDAQRMQLQSDLATLKSLIEQDEDVRALWPRVG